MSRLIVKNLSSAITDVKLKEKFSQYGTVTDTKLMFTKSGKFRRFAFVGYRLEEEAERAKSKLHKSLLINQRIVVETCKDFGVHQEKTNKTNRKVLTNVEESEAAVTNKAELTDAEFLKANTQASLSDDEGFSEDEKKVPVTLSASLTRHHIRMRGCPFSVKQKNVEEFFFPIKTSDVNIQKNEHGTTTGMVFVNFSSEEDIAKALKLNGQCIGGRYIELFRVSEKDTNLNAKGSQKSWMKKVKEGRDDCETEDISESGRLFIRNLSFTCSEDDLEKRFMKFGPLSEVSIPLDTLTRKSVGFGFVTFMMPEHALKAFNELDGTAFQGRMIHILPAKSKVEHSDDKDSDNKSSYKKEKAAADKKLIQSSHNWNSLFVGTSAVADAIAEKYNEDKNVILSSTDNHSAAVRVALGETQIIKETREFLIENGVSLDAFSQANSDRSKTVIIAKNLPVGSTSSELRTMFEKHASLGRVLLAPAGVTAIIECQEPSEARTAFLKLAYRKFHHKPLFLEWAPMGTFLEHPKNKKVETAKIEEDAKDHIEEDAPEEINNETMTLFVKNLNFETTDQAFHDHFAKCGVLKSSAISRKKTHKRNVLLSMGYGFITYKVKADGQKALKTLQNSMLDGHKLELKLSERKQVADVRNGKKKQEFKKQGSSKIIVRNVPFQANVGELQSLFKSFGELKSVRIPKKLGAGHGQTGTSNHRGFAFVDFVTKQDAKSAFETLCHSTHLYGRRLVLEWANTEEDSIEGLRRKTSEQYHGDSKKRKTISSFEEELASAAVEIE